MNITQDLTVGDQFSTKLMDVLIRASLLAVLVFLCYTVFSPFLTLMAWSIILAVTLFPLHQRIARKLRNKQWLASTIIAVIASVLIIVPSALLLSSLADSVRDFVGSVQNNTLVVPAPRESITKIPIVGQKIYDGWSLAHNDFPAFVANNQPKISDLARTALGAVASIGKGLLFFIASFITASIIMAYGGSGESTTRAIFSRIAGPKRGNELTDLSTATIRAVALGVLGVAFVQAVLVGLALVFAGVPAAGVLALITLVLGIAQVPAFIVTLPAIVYIWSSGTYETGSAVLYTIILLLVGLVDNALKPLMLGRGVDVPMPVILFGALGGMATGGILGMFVGATLLALGYEIFMTWVYRGQDANDETETETATGEPTLEAAAAVAKGG